MCGDLLLKTIQAYLAAELYAKQAEHGSAEGRRREAELEAARRRLKEQLTRNGINPCGPGEENPPAAARRPSGRVLVAVDSSPQAGWAAEVAVAVARQFSAMIALVHVVPAPAVIGPEVPASEADLRIQLHHEGEELLATFESRLPWNLPHRVTIFLREGNVAEEIIAVAGAWHAELIVIGTHGRGRLGQFLLGSVASAVISRSPCPVLTVGHPPASESALFETAPERAGERTEAAGEITAVTR
jgi:nucleotide-binding universal stress UspA family protein